MTRKRDRKIIKKPTAAPKEKRYRPKVDWYM
jgi:hypothetical protein